MFGDVLAAKDPKKEIISQKKYPGHKTNAAFFAYHVELIKKLLGKGMSPTAALHVFVQMLLSNFDEFLGFGMWDRASNHDSKREALCIIQILSIIMAEKPDTNNLVNIILEYGADAMMFEYISGVDEICGATIIYQQAFLLTYFLKLQVISMQDISLKLNLDISNLTPKTCDQIEEQPPANYESRSGDENLASEAEKLAVAQLLKSAMDVFSKKSSWWAELKTHPTVQPSGFGLEKRRIKRPPAKPALWR